MNSASSTPSGCDGYVSITRAAADEPITAAVINRLSHPDARQLFEPTADPAVDEERQALRQRRDGITQLLGEGLIQPTAARPLSRPGSDGGSQPTGG